LTRHGCFPTGVARYCVAAILAGKAPLLIRR
jgi:hypothetical protein